MKLDVHVKFKVERTPYIDDMVNIRAQVGYQWFDGVFSEHINVVTGKSNDSHIKLNQSELLEQLCTELGLSDLYSDDILKEMMSEGEFFLETENE